MLRTESSMLVVFVLLVITFLTFEFFLSFSGRIQPKNVDKSHSSVKYKGKNFVLAALSGIGAYFFGVTTTLYVFNQAI